MIEIDNILNFLSFFIYFYYGIFRQIERNLR